MSIEARYEDSDTVFVASEVAQGENQCLGVYPVFTPDDQCPPAMTVRMARYHPGARCYDYWAPSGQAIEANAEVVIMCRKPAGVFLFLTMVPHPTRLFANVVWAPYGTDGLVQHFVVSPVDPDAKQVCYDSKCELCSPDPKMRFRMSLGCPRADSVCGQARCEQPCSGAYRGSEDRSVGLVMELRDVRSHRSAVLFSFAPSAGRYTAQREGRTKHRGSRAPVFHGGFRAHPGEHSVPDAPKTKSHGGAAREHGSAENRPGEIQALGFCDMLANLGDEQNAQRWACTVTNNRETGEMCLCCKRAGSFDQYS